jgi:hypothetical protein
MISLQMNKLTSLYFGEQNLFKFFSYEISLLASLRYIFKISPDLVISKQQHRVVKQRYFRSMLEDICRLCMITFSRDIYI